MIIVNPEKEILPTVAILIKPFVLLKAFNNFNTW
jgi:hypothetical protein